MLPDTLTRDQYRAAVAAEAGLVREVEEDMYGNHSEAVYSPDLRHRYLLTRRWGTGGTTATFIMLNPSTATAQEDDPTIRRCIGYARDWGHSELVVVNLFAYRATKPMALREADDMVGPRNDYMLLRVCQPEWLTVAAWGAFGNLNGRGQQVADMLTDAGVDLSCLGVTASGQPRHPLYMLGNLTPQLYLAAT